MQINISNSTGGVIMAYTVRSTEILLLTVINTPNNLLPSSFKLKMYQYRFRPGSAPKPAGKLMSYVPQDPLIERRGGPSPFPPMPSRLESGPVSDAGPGPPMVLRLLWASTMQPPQCWTPPMSNLVKWSKYRCVHHHSCLWHQIDILNSIEWFYHSLNIAPPLWRLKTPLVLPTEKRLYALSVAFNGCRHPFT